MVGCTANAQQTTQVQLKIESTNRTLTVSADERVTADPDLAILHVGFQTPPSDAKTAYAAGAKTSNGVVAVLKQAGIPEASIRSESQRLEGVDSKAHKFKLVQSWAVKTPPERAAEILDIAIAAGATESGEIDWTLKDVQALEDQALDRELQGQGQMRQCSPRRWVRIWAHSFMLRPGFCFCVCVWVCHGELREWWWRRRGSPSATAVGNRAAESEPDRRVYAVYAVE